MDFKKAEVKIGKAKYSILAFSEMGFGKLENQDSYEIYSDEDQIIITLADGLGSATFSKEGSSKIVSILTKLIKENTDDESLPITLLREWKNAVKGNLNLYDTTVKFIHIKNETIRYGGVGDGWIAINKKDDFISLVASNTFSNQTDSILSFDLNRKFINKEVNTIGILNLLIATDGFSEDIEKDNGKAFMDDVFESVCKDENGFENEMKETLINWPVETNKDDKTVIFVHREEA